MDGRERIRMLRDVTATAAFGALFFTAGFVARGGPRELVIEDAVAAGKRDAHFSESCAVRSDTLRERARRMVLERLSAKDRMVATFARRLSCRNERVRLLADTPGANPFVDSSVDAGYSRYS